jgi:site-specific recombinase XerD
MRTFTVVDDSGLPVEAIEGFLSYVRTTAGSANTVRSYGRHLAFLFRWLDHRQIDWERIDFPGLCAFVDDMRDGTVPALDRAGVARPPAPRSRSTLEAVLAAVCSFYEYWRAEGRGPANLSLYRDARISGKANHSFLAHIEHRNPRPERRIKIRGPKSRPTTIVEFEADFQKLLKATTTHRDRLLLSGLYDGGIRIGQALGLRHEDIDIARRRITIVRRTDNSNGALSKQKATFTVEMPVRFFEFYGDALVEEQLALDIDSDYVFVNLAPPNIGRPLSYDNAIRRVKSIGSRAGVELTPHTLRHTHGTQLAKNQWTASMIAARLGQGSASSADRYVHLSSDDIASKYRETFETSTNV